MARSAVRLVALLLCAASAFAGTALDIHFIDVEGGAATLILTPAGEAVLADAGWPPEPERGFRRIVAKLRETGVRRIDYFIATHFHAGHVGGVEALSKEVEIARFLDHGESVEAGTPAGRELWERYVRLAGERRGIVAPGDEIALQGARLTIVSAGGRLIQAPRAASHPANPLCADTAPSLPDPSENAQSVGFLLTTPGFRFLSLGDLTRERERALACPTNLVGQVELLQASHHGRAESGPAELVRALAPAAAVVNNGPRSVSDGAALQTLVDAVGADVWLLHEVSLERIVRVVPETRFANRASGGAADGAGFHVRVLENGAFVIRNERNQVEKRYEK